MKFEKGVIIGGAFVYTVKRKPVDPGYAKTDAYIDRGEGRAQVSSRTDFANLGK